MLDRVNFWTISGLKDQANILWYPQLFGPVPAGLIDLHDHEVVGKVLGHLRQKEIHHLCIGVRQDEAGHQALLWCHRRIDIAGLANDLSGRLWADAWWGPSPFGGTEAAKASLGHAPSLGQVACPLPGGSRPPPGRWPGSFFKLRLCFRIGFRMNRAGNGLAPSMPVEEPGDRAFVNLVAHLCFKRALDFACGGNFSPRGTREKGG